MGDATIDSWRLSCLFFLRDLAGMILLGSVESRILYSEPFTILS